MRFIPPGPHVIPGQYEYDLMFRHSLSFVERLHLLRNKQVSIIQSPDNLSVAAQPYFNM
jgi:hypothetical protein